MTEWSDVQALISMGLVNRSQSAHLLLSIKDVDAFKKWLAKDLIGPRRRLATTLDVTGNYDPDSKGKPLYQIAFTPEGLTKMGAREALLKQFPDPFLKGMAPALNEKQAEALRLYNLAKPDERAPGPPPAGQAFWATFAPITNITGIGVVPQGTGSAGQKLTSF